MLNSTKQNKKVESSERNQTESSLNHHTFDYEAKLSQIVDDLIIEIFKQEKYTITKEMIDRHFADCFSKIEDKIHVESEDILNYLDDCIKWASNNRSSNEEISLVFNYGSASKSIFDVIKNDILRIIICDEGFAKRILPSSSYFETINNQTIVYTTVTVLKSFFESEKSIFREMNNLDLIGLLNFIVGFIWRSNEQFNIN